MQSGSHMVCLLRLIFCKRQYIRDGQHVQTKVMACSCQIIHWAETPQQGLMAGDKDGRHGFLSLGKSEGQCA